MNGTHADNLQSTQFGLRQLFLFTTLMAIVAGVVAVDTWAGGLFGGVFVPAFYRGKAELTNVLRERGRRAQVIDFASAICFALFIEFAILIAALMATTLFNMTVGSGVYQLGLPSRLNQFTDRVSWFWGISFIINHGIGIWISWPETRFRRAASPDES